MKKIIAIFTVLISIFSAVVPMSSLAVTIDDVKSDTESIKSTVEDNNSTVYDIWNYINNALMPAIQNSGGANNATKDDINDVKNSMSDESEKGIESYFKKKEEESKNDATIVESTFKFGSAMLNAANDQWKRVGKAIKDNGISNSLGLSLNPKDYSTGNAINIIKTFAYGLVLIFFAINLIETSIKYEIFTLKGAVNIFGRLILAKIVIDMSADICIFILTATGDLAEKIINLGTQESNVNIPAFKPSFENSKAAFVGVIIDFFRAIVIIIPIVFIALITLLASSIVTIKLIFRSIELSLLVIISPAFFACYSSETTKPYFRNFILTFIQVASQVVFMAIVYYLCTAWMLELNNIGDVYDSIEWFVKCIPSTLVMIAMAIMMVKPPRVLTSLVR